MKKTGIKVIAALWIVALAITLSACSRDRAAEPSLEAEPASSVEENVAVEPFTGLPSDRTPPPGMQLAAENDGLALYIHPDTAEVAVEDLDSGELWYSNPPGRLEAANVSPLYQSKLSSQFTLTYLNENGQLKEYNSYDDSVAKKQYRIERTADGAIKVTYTIGNIVKGLDVIPLMISEERFNEEILEKIEDEATRTSVGYKFAFDNDRKVYTPRPMQDFVIEQVATTLESIGYTAEDAAFDNKENGLEAASAARNVQFTVALQYALEDDRFVISVPTADLDYPEQFPIESLALLESFGAADAEAEGYLFVPDGSGALIHLNNGKTSADAYDAPVYGLDEALILKERVQVNEPVRLPVFGIVSGGHAMLAEIEEGDALAYIHADIAGRNHPYNQVFSRFQLMNHDAIKLSSGTESSAIPVFQPRIYEGSLKVSFSFLHGKDASYSGMASLYRERLADRYGWERNDADSLPFVLQLEGAFPRKQSFLGVPYKSLEPLTTYEQAGELAASLHEAGIENLKLRYMGWFNGGIRHKDTSSIKLEGKLGGAAGFEQLKQTLNEQGAVLYPDVAFMEKYKGASGSSYFLNKERAKIYAYSPVHYMEDPSTFSHYVLSPAVLHDTATDFLDAYGKVSSGGLALRDLGQKLNSDFDTQVFVDRQQALVEVEQTLSKISEETDQVMISGGHAYTLGAADVVIDAPLRSSRFQLFDEDVPFYQMVLHGYIDVAGQPWNMGDAQDLRLQLLQSLETGSAVAFDWFYTEPHVVKDTDYDHLYSAYYKDWFEQAVDLYQQANEVLKQMQGQTIVSHERLTADVVRTTFENGVQITINYGEEAFVLDGERIEAESYGVRP